MLGVVTGKVAVTLEAVHGMAALEHELVKVAHVGDLAVEFSCGFGLSKDLGCKLDSSDAVLCLRGRLQGAFVQVCLLTIGNWSEYL